MLTRFVRTQLIIFTIASIIGVGVMVIVLSAGADLLGIGRITVKLELPENRWPVPVLERDLSRRADRQGHRRRADPHRRRRRRCRWTPLRRFPPTWRPGCCSVSAVGEQYVDLVPRNRFAARTCTNGSVIPVTEHHRSRRPSARCSTRPTRCSRASRRTGFDRPARRNVYKGAQRRRRRPQHADGFRIPAGRRPQRGRRPDPHPGRGQPPAAGRPAGVHRCDPHLGAQPGRHHRASSTPTTRKWRGILANGPGAADEASALFNQIKPTLPVLLANLTTVGQVAVTYNASLEQLLVLLPPYIGSIQAVGSPLNNPTGMTLGDFTLTINDPPACTVGFLPPSRGGRRRTSSDVDTPDGLYCKLPQDSPIAVRGARNYPCQGQPGKRAPTVEICDSDKPYEPLAMRQHATGPYPIDPNLIAQGIPPDDRTTFQRPHLRPAGRHPAAAGSGAGRAAASEAPLAPAAVQVPPATQAPAPPDVPNMAPTDQGGGPVVAPSAFTGLAPVARRWRSPPTTRRPGSTPRRTATCSARPIWSSPGGGSVVEGSAADDMSAQVRGEARCVCHGTVDQRCGGDRCRGRRCREPGDRRRVRQVGRSTARSSQRPTASGPPPTTCSTTSECPQHLDDLVDSAAIPPSAPAPSAVTRAGRRRSIRPAGSGTSSA